MFDRQRFTTTDTGRPADWWYQPKDGPRLYWTHAEWERMRERNQRGATQETSPAILVPARKKRAVSATQHRKKEFANCVICNTRYEIQTKNAKTCSPYCSGVLYKQTQAQKRGA